MFWSNEQPLIYTYSVDLVQISLVVFSHRKIKVTDNASHKPVGVFTYAAQTCRIHLAAGSHPGLSLFGKREKPPPLRVSVRLLWSTHTYLNTHYGSIQMD